VSNRPHPCPGNCSTKVVYSQFSCVDCWPRLPLPMREAILSSARRRYSEPQAHREAMSAAAAWYRQHPLRPAGGES